MLYTAHEMQRAMLASMGTMAQSTSEWLLSPANPASYIAAGPAVARALEVFAHANATRGKPDFNLAETIVNGRSVAVTEEILLRKPFGQLKHFSRAVS
ncbi:MAG: polyhydroxyalkanoate depolymerase, partial [Sandarakinorhabdus sp.]|nr:polyhydroxyalkanoate depolymerase [Sandarakinorhabdus sp.]